MRAILLLVVIATVACGSDHVAEVERAEPNAEAEGVLPCELGTPSEDELPTSGVCVRCRRATSRREGSARVPPSPSAKLRFMRARLATRNARTRTKARALRGAALI